MLFSSFNVSNLTEYDKCYFFSGHDCTEAYGCSPLQGSFTPFIHRAFKPEVTSCILDGEVVIYSSKLNCIGDY